MEEMSEYGFRTRMLERSSSFRWMPYAKLVLALVALFIAFLFALNGRYHFADDSNMIVDKWTGNIGCVLDDEIDWGN